MKAQQISPETPEVQAFIHKLDRYQESLYPSESNHLDSIDTLMQPHVYFVGVKNGGELAGIGAVKRFDAYGEIKRMFILEKFRGKGIGKKIIKALETHLVQHHIFLARLETGIHQSAAIGLYETMGYIRTGPFGDYPLDTLSVFMEKKIKPMRASGSIPSEKGDLHETFPQ